TCVFCNALDHRSIACPKYTLWEVREKIRETRNLCWHCLGHFRSECKEPAHIKPCTHCLSRNSILCHNPALCKFLNLPVNLTNSFGAHTPGPVEH
ncbi:hypothetical protein PMAYCL1PPCAC_13146, partial [Pristionchus mayeri]